MLLDALRRRLDAGAADLRQHQQGLWRSRRRRARGRRRRAICRRDPQLRAHGIGEDRPLDFHTPYGCSKGAADQYVLDYARSFGLPTAVLRMSCIYGPRQFGTEDQGWVAHFLHPRAARASRSPSMATAGRCATSCTCDDAVAAYRRRAWRRIGAVSGPRLQSRRRAGERGEPARGARLRSSRSLGADVDAAIRRLAAGRPALLRRRHAAAGRRRSVCARRIGWRRGLARSGRLGYARGARRPARGARMAAELHA